VCHFLCLFSAKEKMTGGISGAYRSIIISCINID
jgi:hypothetical protein